MCQQGIDVGVRMSKLRIASVGIVLAAVGYLAVFALTSWHDRRRNAQALAMEQANIAAHDRACTAEMERRVPEEEAEADGRRGDYRPIVLGIGDDVREEIAVGLVGCTPGNNGVREPKIIREAGHCAEANRFNLAGPHPHIQSFAVRYNRRLLAIAPQQVASACRAATGAVGDG